MQTQGAMHQIDDYLILGPIGRGSYGHVYRARDPKTGDPVAIKWMLGIDPTSREEMLRFQREVEIASALRHPNLVHVLGSGTCNQHPYCVMEYIDGPTLDDVIAQRPEGPPGTAWMQKVAALGTPLFSALQFIHNHRIIHRDLKPANILIDPDNNPRIGDFGMAMSNTVDARRSIAGTMCGTLPYMAPELLRGADADRRTDMFALGVLLIEFISGRLPYTSDDQLTVTTALATSGCMQLHEIVPEAPPAVARVLSRMTATRAEERYFTVAEAGVAWHEAVAEWLAPSARLETPPDPTATDVMVAELVGRQPEIDTVTEGMQRALAGESHVVMVSGPSGMGTSRLLQQAARECRPYAPVLQARCSARQQAPYDSMVPLLQQLVELPAAAGARVERVRHLLDGTTPAEDAADVQDAAVPQKMSLYEEVRRLLALATKEGAPLVVILDDVHDADAASLEMLLYLVRYAWLEPPAGAHRPTLVVLGMREDDASAAAFKESLGSLPLSRAARAHLHWLRLGPLDGAALQLMARSALGLGDRPLPPPLAAILEHETSGIPLVLMELLTTFIHVGVLALSHHTWHWDEAAYARWTALCREGQVTTDEAYRWQRMGAQLLARLSAEQKPILDVCLVGQGGFSLEELLVACSASERAVLDTVELLKTQRVLREDQSGWPVRYTFVNEKMRQLLAADLPMAKRQALSHRWVEALRKELAANATATAPHATQPPAELVFRLMEHCELSAEWSEVSDYVQQAAEQAAARYAYGQARALYGRLDGALSSLSEPRRKSLLDSVSQVLDVQVPAAPDALALLLRFRAAELGVLEGKAEEVIPDILALLETPGPVAATLKVRFWFLLASARWSAGQIAEASAAWEQTLGALGLSVPRHDLAGLLKAAQAFVRSLDRHLVDPHLLARPDAIPMIIECCHGLLYADYFLADHNREYATLYAIMLTMQLARQTERRDLLARGHLLFAYPLLVLPTPKVAKALDELAKSELLVEQVEPVTLRVVLHRDLGWLLWQLGETQRAVAHVEQGLTQARQVSDVSGMAWMLQVLAYFNAHLGHLSKAEIALDEADTLIETIRHRRLVIAARITRGWLRTLQGRLEEARECLETPAPYELMTPFDELNRDIYRGVLARRAGQIEPAIQLLTHCAERFSKTHPGPMWELTVARELVWALAESRSARDVGLLKARARSSHKLAAASPRLATYGAAIQAEVAAAGGDMAGAVKLYGQAVAAAANEGLLPDVAAMQERLARLSHDGPRDQRVQRWNQAAATWHQIGSDIWARHCLAEAEK
jgi:tetratricopeptide (TPR) repeat protein